MPGPTCIGRRVWALSRERSGLAERNVSALIEAGMSAQSDPRRTPVSDVDPKYYYRRSLTTRELLPALGAALAAGVTTFYVVKLFLERTPLRVDPSAGPRHRPRLELMRPSRKSARSSDKNLGRR